MTFDFNNVIFSSKFGVVGLYYGKDIQTLNKYAIDNRNFSTTTNNK